MVLGVVNDGENGCASGLNLDFFGEADDLPSAMPDEEEEELVPGRGRIARLLRDDDGGGDAVERSDEEEAEDMMALSGTSSSCG